MLSETCSGPGVDTVVHCVEIRTKTNEVLRNIKNVEYTMHVSAIRTFGHALTVVMVVASCAFYASYVLLVIAYDTLASQAEDQTIMRSFEWVRKNRS